MKTHPRRALPCWLDETLKFCLVWGFIIVLTGIGAVIVLFLLGGISVYDAPPNPVPVKDKLVDPPGKF